VNLCALPAWPSELQVSGKADGNKARRDALVQELGLDAGDTVVESAGAHTNVKLRTLMQDADLGEAAQETHREVTAWFAERLVVTDVV
jgi:hypothetical protein